MAEHERGSQQKQEKVDQKHRVRQQDSQPLFDHFHAWGQNTLSIGETPFLPRMNEHAELLARAPSDNHRTNLVLQLQQTYGNRYVQRLVESMKVQAKLNVSAPNDVYEQEADRVAKAVTRADNSKVQRQAEEEEEPIQTKVAPEMQRQTEEEEEEPIQTKAAPEMQRQTEEEEEEPIQTKAAPEMQRQAEEEEEELQGKSVGSQPATVSDSLETRIKAARDSGHLLSDNTREQMEQSFGADFSGVRVHTDSEADALNQQLSARAFTTGQDVFFRENEYSPGSDSGRELIAHELTHVVQQSGNNLIRTFGIVQRQDTGMAKATAITRFTGAAKAIQDDWGKKTPAQRADALGALANQELKKADSHPCNIDATKDLGTSNGQFSFNTWTLDINKTIMSIPTVTKERMAEILNTMYHEARHSEQWFRAARWLAGGGWTASQIEAKMGITTAAAAAAVKKPLKPLGKAAKFFRSKEYVKKHEKKIEEAAEWYNSVYGTKAAHRKETYDKLKSTRTALDQAAAKLKTKGAEVQQAMEASDKAGEDYAKAGLTDKPAALTKWEAAYAKWEQKSNEYATLETKYNQCITAANAAHAQYKALPEEADAWKVGGKVEEAYKK